MRFDEVIEGSGARGKTHSSRTIIAVTLRVLPKAVEVTFEGLDLRRGLSTMSMGLVITKSGEEGGDSCGGRSGRPVNGMSENYPYRQGC